jgi:two-component system response regulator ArlR
MVQPRILVVEDDTREMQPAIVRRLHDEDYEVDAVEDRHSALSIIDRFVPDCPDIVVLDLILPNPDNRGALSKLEGIKILKHVFEKNYDFPVVIMSALTDPEIGKLVYDYKAQAYVVKIKNAFDLEVLIGNIRTLLEDHPREKRGLMSADGRLYLNPITKTATLNRERLRLEHKRFDLLHYLMLNPEVSFSNEDLLQEVWRLSLDDLADEDRENKLEWNRQNFQVLRNECDLKDYIPVKGRVYRFEGEVRTCRWRKNNGQ